MRKGDVVEFNVATTKRGRKTVNMTRPGSSPIRGSSSASPGPGQSRHSASTSADNLQRGFGTDPVIEVAPEPDCQPQREPSTFADMLKNVRRLQRILTTGVAQEKLVSHYQEETPYKGSSTRRRPTRYFYSRHFWNQGNNYRSNSENRVKPSLRHKPWTMIGSCSNEVTDRVPSASEKLLRDVLTRPLQISWPRS